MVDVNNIGGPGSPQNRQVRDAGRVGARPTEAGGGQRPESGSGADRVEISSTARQAQELAQEVSRYVREARAQPEVRDETVAQAQRQVQMESSSSLRDQIAREIAQRVVDAIL